MLVIDPLNLDAELIVALCPRGPARRIGPLVPMAMIRRRGDRQHGAEAQVVVEQWREEYNTDLPPPKTVQLIS